MIFLLGTHHERQHNGDGCIKEADNQDFINYVKELAKQQNITLIGEEFSEEALENSKASESTLKQIADALHIEHYFCDPEEQERKKIGIPSCEELRIKLGLPRALSHKNLEVLDEAKKKYFGIREQFWLDKIKNLPANKIIFACGLQHLENFKKLLSENQKVAVILDEKF